MNRILIGIIGLTASSLLFAQNIEKDAIIGHTVTNQQIKLLSEAIVKTGYTCDSVSAAGRRGSKAFEVSCNLFKYKYRFEDRGGKWVILVE